MKGKILLLLLGLSLSSAASDPQAVLKAIVDNQRGGGSVRATLNLSVARTDRQTQYVLDIVSDGNERALIQVKAPPREAGQAFLRDGDNILIYNPTLKRVLRLPPSGRSDSFLGSDLSYSDLSGRDLQRDYTPKITAEDANNLTLELTPQPSAPTPYGKVTIQAKVKGYVPLEVTFFDQRSQAVKKVTFAQYAEVNGHSFPVQTTVEDLLHSGNRTTLVYSDYKFGVSIPSGCFDQRALVAGC
ncbi:MAG: outer membrane lipoprotein-sorting protein [Thermaceae bacterium]|nr:outer membrane lipoprotein-sorting protein [Thermaceae bacterium]